MIERATENDAHDGRGRLRDVAKALRYLKTKYVRCHTAHCSKRATGINCREEVVCESCRRAARRQSTGQATPTIDRSHSATAPRIHHAV
jgi:hypothetical protein